MKKLVALLLTVILAATVSISGTLAFMQLDAQSDDPISDGSVQIKQLEYERNNGELQEFTQEKPLYPAVGEATADVPQSWETLGVNGSSMLYGAGLKNVVDKFVFVENTGESDAYVRTWFAFEQGSYDGNVLDQVIRLNFNKENWTLGEPTPGVEIDGNVYTVVFADHIGAIKAGAISMPSLLQVYMDSGTKNRDVTAIDGNDNGKYEILVFSQAAESGELRNELYQEHPFAKMTIPVYAYTFGELEDMTAFDNLTTSTDTENNIQR